MRKYAALCGLAVTRAHDKAGDAMMIAGYPGSADKFDKAIGDYAIACADQIEVIRGPSSTPQWPAQKRGESEWSVHRAEIVKERSWIMSQSQAS